MTMGDNKWYNEWQRMTTSDNEWQQVVQRMTTNGTSDNEWHRMRKRDNKWQWVTASGTTYKHSTVHFQEWMITILSMTKTDTLF